MAELTVRAKEQWRMQQEKMSQKEKSTSDLRGDERSAEGRVKDKLYYQVVTSEQGT